MGARVLEIRNQEKYERAIQIQQQMTGEVWLAGSDIEDEYNWIWDSNGEAINFDQFWLLNRPYHNNVGKNCLVLSTYMYDDICSVARKSICEFI